MLLYGGAATGGGSVKSAAQCNEAAATYTARGKADHADENHVLVRRSAFPVKGHPG